MPEFLQHATLTLFLACVVAGLSVARTARLISFDDFPPMQWVRLKVFSKVDDDSPIKALMQCPFCLAPWLMAGMIGWAWVSDLHWTWWLINIWWGMSYLAASYVAYDQPE
jgi:hypothetical protein